ncbi:hypothetical protein Droror1_Dr00013103 [Drosera rotundifolia]
MCQRYYSTPLSMEKTLRIRTKAHTTTTAKQANSRESNVRHDGGGGGGRGGCREEVWTETTEAEEPLSPFGRAYHTASLNTCILVIFGFATSLDIGFLKERMEKTLIRHPRLRSKPVLDTKDGEKERWVLMNTFNLDDHVIVPVLPDLDPDMEKPDKFIEDYASDLSSTPVDLSKPLWEFHVLNVKTSNAESVGIFKIHHSLGDGMSLVSLTLAASRKSSKPEELPSIPTSMKPVSKSGKRSLYMYLVAIWLMLQLIWNTFVGITHLLATSLFLRDTNTLIDSKKVNVHSKKKIVHRLISLDDIKLVKNEASTTVNDVVVGLTSAALSCYLRTTSHDEGSISTETDYSKKKICLRATVAVNAREAVGIKDLADMMDKGSKCKWGNVTGCIVIPLHVAMEKDPLEYVRKAKLVMDKKKLSLDAKVCYYMILFGRKLLGLKLGTQLMYAVASNATVMFSNVVGPAEEIDFCGHRVAYITPTARTAQGHAPGVVIHFMSYMNKMSVAVCANQDMLPEPHKLLDEVEGSLREMKKMEGEEEPLSPCGRLYHTLCLNVSVVVIFGFATKIDVNVLKERMEKTWIRHPRFSSKLLLDVKKGQKERWVRTKVNSDDHFIVLDLDQDMENPDQFIEDYASDLSSTPVDLSKPLWEFHVLNVKTSNAESVGIFKIHHSLGDGMSLVSLTLAASRKSSKPEELPSIPTSMKPVSKSGNRSLYMYLVAIWLMLQLIWNTLLGITHLLATALFLRDTNTLIDSKEVTVHSKKRIVHRVISLDDIKLVKNETNTTINDVVVGLTGAALSRYLHATSHERSISAETDCPKKEVRLRANVAVNVREADGIQDLADMMDKGSKCKWGNVTGCIVIPLHVAVEKDPLEYIRKAKLVIDKKKLSFDAKVTYYLIRFGQSLLGLKLSARLMYGVASNTTVMFSNVVGPAEEIDFCGHRVAYITPTARTAQGHAPGVVIHFMSYMNKMSVAVCANQDMLPEPHKLLDDVEGSLRDMKKVVLERKLNRKGLD